MATYDINTPDYIVLPSEGGGIPGPQGPIGPQGPPGIGELPVPAEDVSVTNPGYANAQEIFDYLLYLKIDITSFTATKTIYEIGESITALGFSWGLNKADITSQIITGSHIESGVELGIFTRNTVVNFSPPLATAASFILSVNDAKNITTSTRSINFYSGVYYGSKATPAVINSDFILTLDKNLQADRRTNFTSDAGKDIYVWYANKVALGIANFNFGGFDGGMESPITVSFTNSKGHTEDYYVYRSINPWIGVVNVIVT